MCKYPSELVIIPPNRNRYLLICQVHKAMSLAGASQDELNSFLRESTVGGYRHAVYVAQKYVSTVFVPA
jgi:hypothetical protein